MSYQDKSDLYRNPEWRGPAEMCVREQGLVFSADGRPDMAALGQGVVAGNIQDIEAVLAATASYSAYDPSGGDPALLAAVQYVWPSVAAARYPQT